MEINTTNNLSEGDRKAIVEHFSEEVVNFTLKNIKNDYVLAKSIFFKAASKINKLIKQMDNE
jgi:hypothetical protein|tara:strand:- start:84 stop:269 length:186 start_codon:yes stop_codon:yes gene_type:complete